MKSDISSKALDNRDSPPEASLCGRGVAGSGTLDMREEERRGDGREDTVILLRSYDSGM
jgi:hypothetical protein